MDLPVVGYYGGFTYKHLIDTQQCMCKSHCSNQDVSPFDNGVYLRTLGKPHCVMEIVAPIWKKNGKTLFFVFTFGLQSIL